MVLVAYIIACIVIGSASYALTSLGLTAVFGKRLRIKVKDQQGSTVKTVVRRYRPGDEVDKILRDIES